MSQTNPLQHWFLLRGLGRESGHWRSFCEKLRDSVPRARVHLLDLPGMGSRHTEKSPWRISQMAAEVRDEYLSVLEKEKIGQKSPKFLIALSLGGMVAVHWLHQHPEDFSGAVLINSSLRGVSPAFSRLSPGAYGRLLRAVFARRLEDRERHILDLTSQSRTREDKELQIRVQIGRQNPITRHNFFRQLVAAATDFPPTDKPPVPLLILNSLGDEMVHPDCSEELHKRWGVPILRHAWAGHDLPLDDPQWTIEAIRSWMLGNGFVFGSPLSGVVRREGGS